MQTTNLLTAQLVSRKGEGRKKLATVDPHEGQRKQRTYAAVTSASLLVAVDIGHGDEYENRTLSFPLLKSIRIRSGFRLPWKRLKQVYASNKYHAPLVMMKRLAARDIATHIKGRTNKKRRPDIPSLFETYIRIRSSIEQFSGRLKSFKRIQTRYNRSSSTYFVSCI